ncbi:MAG: YncE family protein [Thermoplasmata archaeon]|nr:YncE family protein [Thermoplasmata archaeon]
MVPSHPRRGRLILAAVVAVTVAVVVAGLVPLRGDVGPATTTPSGVRVDGATVGTNATLVPLRGDPASDRTLGVMGGRPAPSLGPRPQQVGNGGTIVDRVAVGGGPYPGVFDNRTGELYVSNVQTGNVSVIQTANNTVVATIPVGTLPQMGCLDPTDGDLYVSNFFSGNVSVISTATNRVVASINTTLGYEPTTCTYDAVTDQVYVPNPNYSTNYPYLTVIYGSNHTVKTNIQLGDGTGIDPITPTLDPANGLLYVAMSSAYYSNNWVVIVNASTDATPSTLSVGFYPTQPTFDSVNGWLYVANNGDQTVSVINGTDNTLLPHVTVGYGPNTPAVDPTTGDVFVPVYLSGSSGNLTVLNGSTNNVTTVVPVGPNPQTPLVDPQDGDLYVAEANDVNLTVVSMTTDAILSNYSIGSGVLAPTLDGIGDLYVPYEIYSYTVGGIAVIASDRLHASLFASTSPVAEGNPLSLTTAVVGGSGLLSFSYANLPGGCTSSDLAELNCTPTQPGTFSLGVSVSDAHGDEANASLNLTVLAAFPLSLTESGLPQGTTWFFNATGLPALRETAANATFDVPNGTYSYHLATGNKDFAPDRSAPLFAIHGGPVALWANFSLVTYPITFAAIGLPNGTSWFVNVSGLASQSATGVKDSVELDNGTHGFTVTSSDRRYSPTPSVGTVTVAGGTRTVNVTFRYLVYTLVVTRTGLPADGLWYFNLTGGRSMESSVGEITEPLANASYDYSVATADKSYAPTSSTGTFTVHGSGPLVNITFAPVTFTIPFTESGLPGGTTWTVHLGATALTGSTATLDGTAMNGTYAYTVGAISGWAASRYSGTVTVDGVATAAVAVTWSAVVYAVTFTESGLPGGTSWSVTVLGTSHSTSQPSLALDLANGSYAYTYGELGGYALGNGSGELVVEGTPTGAAASYAATNTGAFALPLVYLALGAAIVIAAVVGAIVWMRRRPRSPASDAAETPAEPDPGEPDLDPATNG